jgi:hypothetical protein
MLASGRGEEVRIRCLKKLRYSITDVWPTSET